jgi:hypothetical protein
MNTDSDFDEEPGDSDELPYRLPSEIEFSELREALGRLELFGGDPFLRQQAYSLCAVDQFITGLEYDVLRKLNEEEHTPVPEAMFLSAQSQMWIFAVYEMIRTWRQRAKNIIKWSENGGLEAKLQVLEKDIGYQHFGRKIRAEEIRRILTDPAIVDRVRVDLRSIHIPFARIEAIRISIAKHEVGGHKNSVALRPGYARINQWCGSLDYELENGIYSMGFISRRDIADELRALTSNPPPTDETLKEFDAFMRGPPAGL